MVSDPHRQPTSPKTEAKRASSVTDAAQLRSDENNVEEINIACDDAEQLKEAPEKPAEEDSKRVNANDSPRHVNELKTPLSQSFNMNTTTVNEKTFYNESALQLEHPQ